MQACYLRDRDLLDVQESRLDRNPRGRRWRVAREADSHGNSMGYLVGVLWIGCIEWWLGWVALPCLLARCIRDRLTKLGCVYEDGKDHHEETCIGLLALKTNEEVLQLVQGTRNLMDLIWRRKKNWIGYILRG